MPHTIRVFVTFLAKQTKKKKKKKKPLLILANTKYLNEQWYKIFVLNDSYIQLFDENSHYNQLSINPFYSKLQIYPLSKTKKQKK